QSGRGRRPSSVVSGEGTFSLGVKRAGRWCTHICRSVIGTAAQNAAPERRATPSGHPYRHLWRCSQELAFQVATHSMPVWTGPAQGCITRSDGGRPLTARGNGYCQHPAPFQMSLVVAHSASVLVRTRSSPSEYVAALSTYLRNSSPWSASRSACIENQVSWSSLKP